MDRQPILEGDRLILRPLREEDWEALFAVAADPEIWARHPSHDRWQEPVFRQFFDEAMVSGGGLAILDKATGDIVGSSRFGQPDQEAPGEIEIGWSFLARKYWGRGWNAEFKRLMLAHALDYFENVIFQVGADNVISRRAMTNIGGQILPGRTRSYERCGVIVEHVIFAIDRESFANGPLQAAQI